MNWRVLLHKRAQKDIQRLDERTQEKIWGGLRRLKQSVESGTISEQDIRKLKGAWQGFYRLRVGSYRIIFKIAWEKREILIYGVSKRENAY